MAPKMTSDDDGIPARTMTPEALTDLLKRTANAVNTAPSAASLPTDSPPAEPPPATPPPPPPAMPTASSPITTFGSPPPSFGSAQYPPLTTEDILGHPLKPVESPTPPPELFMPPGEIGAQKKIEDALTKDRAKAERDEKDPKKKAEFALASLMRDHPGTKLINVQLLWRDPSTGEYRKKGRRKNISANEVRDPDSFCVARDGSGTHYGGDWILGYMPADQGKLFDDPKVWYWFEFPRDGPLPPHEWTIDQPYVEPVFVEVEGMGQIPVTEFKDMMRGWLAEMRQQPAAPATPAPAAAPATPPIYSGPPGYGPSGYGGPPGYGGQGYSGPGYGAFQPLPRDTKAEEREKKLEDALEEQRKQTALLMQRLGESDRKAAEDRAKIERESSEARAKAERDAADARHAAEIAAIKAGFQATVDQTTRALEAVTAKLASVELKVNQPPPPPPTPPPQTDLGSVLANALPHIKDIVTTSRTAEAETVKARETALIEERRREKEDRDRQREDERQAREREREEYRERRDREREEERQRREAGEREERARRDAAERESTQTREQARQTLDQYRMMGEQSLSSARTIAEITGKQQDPGPALTVMNAMTQQTVQNAQLLATLVKNNVLGGGGGQAGTNWGDVLGNAFEMLGNVGAAFAEASATKAKVAAQQPPPPPPPQMMMPPQPMPQPMPQRPQPMPQPMPQRPVAVPRAPAPSPSMAGMPPPQAVPPQAVPPQTPPNPLSMLVAGVNQSVARKEPPEKVAGKLASIVHVAQEFGTSGEGKPVTGALRALMDDPRKFLKRAYPAADQEYLEEIAKILLTQYGPEEGEGADEEETEAQDAEETQEAAQDEPQEAEPQEATPTPQEAAPTPVASDPPPPEAPKPPPQPTEAEMLAAMEQQAVRPVPPPAPKTPRAARAKPGVTVVVSKPKPEAVPQEAAPASPETGDNGNGKPKRRGRGGTRRKPTQVGLPEVVMTPTRPPPAPEGDGAA